MIVPIVILLMFQKAKEKRKEIASRLDSFNRFRHTIGTDKVQSVISNSAEKRNHIQNSFENWAIPLSKTGFDPKQCDLSMSFRASEFRPKPVELVREHMNEQSREMLQRQFYEDVPDNNKILDQSQEESLTKVFPEKNKESPQKLNEKPNQSLVKIVEEVEPIEHVQTDRRMETDGIIPSDIVLMTEPATKEENKEAVQPIKQIVKEAERQPQQSQPLPQKLEQPPQKSQEQSPQKPSQPQPNTLIPSTHLQQPLTQDISIRQSDLVQFFHRQTASPQPLAVSNKQEKAASPQPQPLAGSNINNSSQGIFFTQDFKQFLNQKHQQHHEPQKAEDPIKQPKWPQNQQTLQKVFSQKINTHLILSLEDITLLRLEAGQAAKKIKTIAQQKYQKYKKQHLKKVINVLNLTNRLATLERRVKYQKLYLYFLHIKLYRQYRENKLTKKIAIARLRQKMLKDKVTHIFQMLKSDAKAKRDMNRMIGECLKTKELEKCMKNWKLYTFGKRIKKQAQLFRLSGIFNAWKQVSRQEKGHKEAKALRFFYRSCMRRGMQFFKEAVIQSQISRQQNRQSYIHHTLSLQRKIFNAWRDTAQEMMDQKMNRQYIAVEMTLKDGIQNKGSQLIKTRQLLFN